jgi:hypothetical protein
MDKRLFPALPRKVPLCPPPQIAVGLAYPEAPAQNFLSTRLCSTAYVALATGSILQGRPAIMYWEAADAASYP